VDLSKINEFREELQKQITLMQSALSSLDILSGQGKKRGRPKKIQTNNVTAIVTAMPIPISKGGKWTVAQRKAASLRAKAMWAARNKKKKAS
jgi:hypothetical protein